MIKFKMELEIKITDTWVADGFDIEASDSKTESGFASDIHEAIQRRCLGSYGHEIQVLVKNVKKPKAAIKALQNGDREIKD